MIDLRSLAARSHPRRQPPERIAAAVVSLAAALAVYAIAIGVFPYHSINHDEGVYLQQAAMLLDGQLSMQAGELADAVRPWFFVDDGGRLYPKYQPVPAALYALAIATVGEPRVALAAVAAGNAALVYVLGATAFDRRVGVLAAVAFAASPMALVTTATFLPYAPTTLLNLAFAVLYLRALRTGSVGTAALAGGAVGLAFFARPYTAVLFAAPFIAHAGWQVIASVRRGGVRPLSTPVRRNLATGAVGLAFVGVALAYNAVVTGDPLLFPYAAFAPEDGPGFGHREILGHEVDYTLELATLANANVLRFLLTRWGPAGPVGSLLAVVGLAAAARQWAGSGLLARLRDGAGSLTEDRQSQADDPLPDASRRQTTQVLLAALFVSVPLGNLAFWGNNNVLGTLTDPTDGLVAFVGPIYHFDLLAPLAIFAAAGLLTAWRGARALRRSDGQHPDDPPSGSLLPDAIDRQRAGSVALALVVATALLAGASSATVLTEPIERNAANTAELEQAYEPFEDHEIERGVVFVPTPYGPWLNHPFQALRNDDGLDGPVVYAMDRFAAGDFEVVDAYPDRPYYRYTYRGDWEPGTGDPVQPKIERQQLHGGERLAGETTVGVPDGVDHAVVRLSTGPDEHVRIVHDDPDDSVAAEWTLENGGAWLDGTGAGGASVDANETDDSAANGGAEGSGTGDGADATVAIDETDEVVLEVRLVQHDGSSLTYRQETTVRTTEAGVEALWPPERTVCPLVDDCGRRGTYLPDRPEAHIDGVAFETELSEG